MDNTLESALGDATLEELWDEMKKRFTNAVLIYEQQMMGKIGTDACCNNLYFQGSYATLLGLCQYGTLQSKAMILGTFVNEPEIDD